jgi:hypothetical protein
VGLGTRFLTFPTSGIERQLSLYRQACSATVAILESREPSMSRFDHASRAAYWLLGAVFTYLACWAFLDGYMDVDPRGYSRFATLICLAGLCSHACASYRETDQGDKP